ncbi:MAG: guanylate kinase [Eubacterium sp.]|nr:guanylate kinase [Eubacterium sp.]
MNQRGVLTIVSGFAGSGKGTLMKRLLELHDNYALSISATTRSPRAGETEGKEYFFKTKEEFEEMIQEQAFLEYACYVGNYYGTPKFYVEEQLQAGRDVILEIEIQGALAVKKMMPETVLVFVTPPTAEELEKRLKGRGTETEEVIRSRIRRAVEESEEMLSYDYLLVNDDIEETTERLHAIIQSAHSEAARHAAFAKEIQAQLKALTDSCPA